MFHNTIKQVTEKPFWTPSQKNYSWDNKSGYFVILSADGTVLFHGTDKNEEGKNISYLKKRFP